MQSNQVKKEKYEDTHILKMWTPLKLEIDEGYNFVEKSMIHRFFSKLLYIIALPILCIYNKMFFGLKIIGKENLSKTSGGKIIVTNHIHPMDCTFVALAIAPSKLYFTTLKSNFEIPIIANIIKLLNAIPIPEKINAKKKFVESIDELLKKGEMVQFYPEGSMWPYYRKLRNFKKGAFEFAVKNDAEVIPMVYTYRQAKGIRKITNKKPLITLNILPPVKPRKDLEKTASIQSLKEDIYNSMNNIR